MRLPIAIGAGLLISLSFNLPVFSKISTPIQVTQAQPSQKNTQILKSNLRLWKKQKIANYRYTLTRSCFCTAEARGPIVIEVRNGVTTAVTYVATSKPADKELFKQYDTIPKLFDVIQDGINRKAASLTVKYHPKFGYPTQINIDYDFQMADEELYLTVEKFEVIK
ncbi:hypothetical protein H6G06_21040 [Anabaena sphaerica FACHB-251]|uniref:Uncharacterized protein n=1 Tax=Anabaena sphaerica FACHB-251 TaxID=2692883 RepID=A0A926WJS1_9NOST|nr:DUF6174 domain-containing protein [Anabaena sphaerica]MBD2295891.1 hypothetical protein [Anabaena sphaerica FACHB-251]